ncbi:MAG: class II fructose-bisphosphate aldolase [Rudaea sp.]
MPLVPFQQLMAEAERGQYAVGYFESWNLESLLAVADAAEAVRSPVLLGFSGIYLPDPARLAREPLSVYAAMSLEVCRRLSVPACLVFNESPHLDWVLRAIKERFGLVMFTDDSMVFDALVERVALVVKEAHRQGTAVEGEPVALAGVGGELEAVPSDLRFTDPARASDFVERTGIDALAVNVGQVHMHGRTRVRLDLDHLSVLQRAVAVPLVLHGASSVSREDLRAATRIGVRKINLGSVLKRTYFEALKLACLEAGTDYNPYEVVGSGLSQDVLTSARLALQQTVEKWMQLFGSAGKAPDFNPSKEAEEQGR